MAQSILPSPTPDDELRQEIAGIRARIAILEAEIKLIEAWDGATEKDRQATAGQLRLMIAMSQQRASVVERLL